MKTEELISLIQQGPEKWNDWQAKNSKAKIIFRDYQFDQQIVLSNITFKLEVEFQNVSFSGPSCVLGYIIFEKKVDFINCQFHELTSIYNCTFRERLQLNNCEWERGFCISNIPIMRLYISHSTIKGLLCLDNSVEGLSLSNSALGAIQATDGTIKSVSVANVLVEDSMIFSGSTFEKANFLNSTIKGNSVFRTVIFEGNANFINNNFHKNAIFSNNTFKEDAAFSGTQFTMTEENQENRSESSINFSGSTFNKAAIFESYLSHSLQENETKIENKSKDYSINHEKMASTDFSGVKFYGETSFQGRKFIGKTNFGPLIKDNEELLRRFSS